jgi:hypothetical protein
MFDESLDFFLRGSWPDCLDDEFGENYILPGPLLSRWKRIRERERGLRSIGKLWNSLSRLSAARGSISPGSASILRPSTITKPDI